MNASLYGAGRPEQGLPPRSQQAYVIEIGETQAGLVSRRGEERFFTFISAASAFDALEGHRFATPGAAERAARQLAGSRRGRGWAMAS
ncbi:hypothetical protein ABIE41_000707 [Bosea sp. OAE506]|jgi:hypothetical protein|uniref:hypothetical protein n=1 Tax=Bosea sp. OAE506 TaxID=2663870 RepID=UPI0019EBB455